MMSKKFCIHVPSSGRCHENTKLQYENHKLKPALIASCGAFGPKDMGFVDRIAEMETQLVYNFLQHLGGYETTSLLMAMAVYFIGHSPPTLLQLKEEHAAIRRRKKDGEHLSWEDYKQMEFTQNVINEALRCGNIVKFVHRKALKDVRFKDYVIPSGWKVLPVFSAVHLDPSLHDNAYEFHPWRWEGNPSSKKIAPFGGGSRLCPGAELAKVETAFFLHHLVLNFRWRTQGMDYPIAYPYVEFQRGLPLKMEPILEATTMVGREKVLVTIGEPT